MCTGTPLPLGIPRKVNRSRPITCHPKPTVVILSGAKDLRLTQNLPLIAVILERRDDSDPITGFCRHRAAEAESSQQFAS